MLQLPAQGPAQPAPEVHARFQEETLVSDDDDDGESDGGGAMATPILLQPAAQEATAQELPTDRPRPQGEP
eukprot:7600544-Alexandrium_andersonii.AAC.1